LDNKDSKECEKGNINAVINGDLYDRDRVRKEITQKMRIEYVHYKKENMSFCCYFCMLFDKWIRKIGIIFCE